MFFRGQILLKELQSDILVVDSYWRFERSSSLALQTSNWLEGVHYAQLLLMGF